MARCSRHHEADDRRGLQLLQRPQGERTPRDSLVAKVPLSCSGALSSLLCSFGPRAAAFRRSVAGREGPRLLPSQLSLPWRLRQRLNGRVSYERPCLPVPLALLIHPTCRFPVPSPPSRFLSFPSPGTCHQLAPLICLKCLPRPHSRDHSRSGGSRPETAVAQRRLAHPPAEAADKGHARCAGDCLHGPPSSMDGSVGCSVALRGLPRPARCPSPPMRCPPPHRHRLWRLMAGLTPHGPPAPVSPSRGPRASWRFFLPSQLHVPRSSRSIKGRSLVRGIPCPLPLPCLIPAWAPSVFPASLHPWFFPGIFPRAPQPVNLSGFPLLCCLPACFLTLGGVAAARREAK